MKFYSDITKKLYDNEEALKEAEQKIQTQLEKKETGLVNERKEAAKLVEKAFADASAQRKENNTKREALDAKSREINKKYDVEIKKIEEQKEAEFETLEDEYRALEKSDKEILEQAYEELRKFCKKYGAYHYSVDAAGADLFPMLMGFGQMEKARNIFSDIFGNMFNLF